MCRADRTKSYLQESRARASRRCLPCTRTGITELRFRGETRSENRGLSGDSIIHTASVAHADVSMTHAPILVMCHRFCHFPIKMPWAMPRTPPALAPAAR